MKRAAGVTLIELLVVLAIIAIISAMIVPRLMESDISKVKREAERLSLLLDLARSSAIQGGHSIMFLPGNGLGDHGYHFASWQDGNWQDIAEGELRARNLPEGMQLSSLVVDGKPASDTVRLVFRPQGISSRFCVQVNLKTSHKQVCGGRIGAVHVAD